MTQPKHVVMLFIDGLGLGEVGPANPLTTSELPTFKRLAGGASWTIQASPVAEGRHAFLQLDATLGVAGLPLSGTGQASLFTGVNCAEVAGRHWGPFPHSTSKPIIRDRSIFARLKKRGRTGQFVNAFPKGFFTYMKERDRWTVTTRSSVEAGLTLRTTDDLRRGNALSADITGASWPENLDGSNHVLTPQQAGRRMASLAQQTHFSLFEHFHIDKAGHAQDADWAGRALREIDGFIEGILDHVDSESTLLVITSDHGNVEDLSRRVHTLNPVPLVAFGAGADAFHKARDLTDVTPTIEALLR